MRILLLMHDVQTIRNGSMETGPSENQPFLRCISLNNPPVRAERYLEWLDYDDPEDQRDVELLRERLRLRLLKGVVLVDHPADHRQ